MANKVSECWCQRSCLVGYYPSLHCFDCDATNLYRSQEACGSQERKREYSNGNFGKKDFNQCQTPGPMLYHSGISIFT